MALRDVTNFQFYSDAITQRFRNPNLKSFKGIPYEPQTNPHSIFGRIYSTFRGLIGKGLNLHQYLNIGQRSVLENLYRNLKSDINLKFLNDPNSVLKDSRFELSDQYYLEQQAAVAGQQAGQIPTGATTSAPVGGMPGMPTTPSITLPRVFVVKQTPPTSGGMEGGPGQGTAATAKGNKLAAEKAQTQTPEQLGVTRSVSTPVTTGQPNPSVAPSQTVSSQRFNFPAFRSSASNFAKKVQNFASPAGPFFKVNLNRIGNGLKNIFGGAGRGIAGPGLTGIANFGGRAGLGAINHGGNFLGNLSNMRSRFSAGGASSLGKATKGRGGLMFLLAILGFMMLVGILNITGSTTPGEAAPLPPGTADISSCKFTRGAERPPDASFKSSVLLSYIQEASQKANIPPVVLAAFIRVESPASSNMSNDGVANYSASCVEGKTGESPTGALGIMQIQPPGTTSARGDPASCDDCIDAGAQLVGKTVSTMTRQDYCDPRTSIIVGAGWILKKMSKLGYGDGTKWDPAWTNDRTAIEALVNTYYGCLVYGGPTDCTGPYNYADDVSTSIQNCKAAAAPAPVPSGDLHQAILDKYRLDMDVSLDQQHLVWTWNVLAKSENSAPLFLTKLQARYAIILVRVWGGIGQRIDNTIYLSNAPGTFLATGGEMEFQQVLIHELGHIIHGVRGDVTYTAGIEKAVQADNSFLTGYAQGATAAEMVCASSDSGERAVQLDEDFAESVSYYINKDTQELNYSKDNKCPPKNPGQNPFRTGKYPNHLKLMQEVLGGTF